MKMKLDQPSSLDTHELPAVGGISKPTQAAIAAFDDKQEPAALAEAFAAAWQYAKAPASDAPPPVAFVWAGTEKGDLDGLLSRMNDHRSASENNHIASVYGGEVFLTHVPSDHPHPTEEDPKNTAARNTIIDKVKALPDADLASLATKYASARIAGRLSTFKDIDTAWTAADKRQDEDAARLCAFARLEMRRLWSTVPLYWGTVNDFMVYDDTKPVAFETIRFPPDTMAAIARTNTDPRADYERLKSGDLPVWDLSKKASKAFGNPTDAYDYWVALAVGAGVIPYERVEVVDDDSVPRTRVRFDTEDGTRFTDHREAQAYARTCIAKTREERREVLDKIRAGESTASKQKTPSPSTAPEGNTP